MYGHVLHTARNVFSAARWADWSILFAAFNPRIWIGGPFNPKSAWSGIIIRTLFPSYNKYIYTPSFTYLTDLIWHPMWPASECSTTTLQIRIHKYINIVKYIYISPKLLTGHIFVVVCLPLLFFDSCSRHPFFRNTNNFYCYHLYIRDELIKKK